MGHPNKEVQARWDRILARARQEDPVAGRYLPFIMQLLSNVTVVSDHEEHHHVRMRRT